MFKSKIVQIQKCLNLNLFNFKIVQIKNVQKSKTVQFWKIRSNSKKRNENQKTEENQPRNKKPIRTSKNRIGMF
jgi:hypothetical protein